MLLELQNVTRLYGIVIGVNDVTLSLAVRASLFWGRMGLGKPHC